jgi:2'-5' RNA ligase
VSSSAHASSRLAVYLVPPYRVVRRVSETHDMLHKQFGFIAASRFPVHATIKGFFRMTAEPLEPLVARLDDVFSRQQPFEVHFSGLRVDPVGIGLDVSRQGPGPNMELLSLREHVVDAVRPSIAPDCDFSAGDLGHPFQAHITLAFRDVPQDLYQDVLSFVRWCPLPCHPFIADTFHLLDFFSEDWGGDWHRTLSWHLIKAWSLPGANPTVKARRVR